jgi:ATP-dependent Clp protease ATP-binding subunit ClpA
VFTRFSPAANRILRLAEQECRNLNHYYVGAEHLLLALCDEPDQATAVYLAELRVSKDRLHAALRRSLGTGEDRMWDGILVTPRVRAIVERAENAAGAGNAVEPVDLLRAIVAERLSTAAEILAQSEGNVRRAGSTPG